MRSLRKVLSLALILSLLFQQIGFAQIASELNIAGYLSRMSSNLSVEKFRPAHLRYFSYNSLNDNFKVLLDKGDSPTSRGHFPSGLSGNSLKESVPWDKAKLQSETQTLLSYFLIGVTLPDSMFWVNLRPDSEDQIIDQYLEKTDVGRIMLEADLQLKKDTAQMTSPATPEGREYWDRLYKKAADLYGYDNVTIPTLTRPWIVPGEIIVRESKDSAYIYKATLKVMLEQDYLKSSKLQALSSQSDYSFKDIRSKALNEYSTQLIKELIIPKLTKEVNSSKRYAPLRQVYYSLILSRWFKQKFRGLSKPAGDIFRQGSHEATQRKVSLAFVNLIDTKNLTNLISKDSWSKTDYFKQYQKSFSSGEYNIQESVYTPTGQVIRSYFSGGIQMDGAGSPINNPVGFTNLADKGDRFYKISRGANLIGMEGNFRTGIKLSAGSLVELTVEEKNKVLEISSILTGINEATLTNSAKIGEIREKLGEVPLMGRVDYIFSYVPGSQMTQMKKVIIQTRIKVLRNSIVADVDKRLSELLKGFREIKGISGSPVELTPEDRRQIEEILGPIDEVRGITDYNRISPIEGRLKTEIPMQKIILYAQEFLSPDHDPSPLPVNRRVILAIKSIVLLRTIIGESIKESTLAVTNARFIEELAQVRANMSNGVALLAGYNTFISRLQLPDEFVHLRLFSDSIIETFNQIKQIFDAKSSNSPVNPKELKRLETAIANVAGSISPEKRMEALERDLKGFPLTVLRVKKEEMESNTGNHNNDDALYSALCNIIADKENPSSPNNDNLLGDGSIRQKLESVTPATALDRDAMIAKIEELSKISSFSLEEYKRSVARNPAIDKRRRLIQIELLGAAIEKKKSKNNKPEASSGSPVDRITKEEAEAWLSHNIKIPEKVDLNTGIGNHPKEFSLNKKRIKEAIYPFLMSLPRSVEPEKFEFTFELSSVWVLTIRVRYGGETKTNPLVFRFYYPYIEANKFDSEKLADVENTIIEEIKRDFVYRIFGHFYGEPWKPIEEFIQISWNKTNDNSNLYLGKQYQGGLKPDSFLAKGSHVKKYGNDTPVVDFMELLDAWLQEGEAVFSVPEATPEETRKQAEQNLAFFKLYFNRDLSGSPDQKFNSSPIEKSDSKPIILIVDDDENIRWMIKNELRKQGFEPDQLLEAESGEEALKILNKQRIDLVLSDYNMPSGINGGELYVKMSKSAALNKIPFVMLTGDPDSVRKELKLPEGVQILNKFASFAEVIYPVMLSLINDKERKPAVGSLTETSKENNPVNSPIFKTKFSANEFTSKEGLIQDLKKLDGFLKGKEGNGELVFTLKWLEWISLDRSWREGLIDLPDTSDFILNFAKFIHLYLSETGIGNVSLKDKLNIANKLWVRHLEFIDKSGQIVPPHQAFYSYRFASEIKTQGEVALRFSVAKSAVEKVRWAVESIPAMRVRLDTLALDTGLSVDEVIEALKTINEKRNDYELQGDILIIPKVTNDYLDFRPFSEEARRLGEALQNFGLPEDVTVIMQSSGLTLEGLKFAVQEANAVKIYRPTLEVRDSKLTFFTYDSKGNPVYPSAEMPLIVQRNTSDSALASSAMQVKDAGLPGLLGEDFSKADVKVMPFVLSRDEIPGKVFSIIEATLKNLEKDFRGILIERRNGLLYAIDKESQGTLPIDKSKSITTLKEILEADYSENQQFTFVWISTSAYSALEIRPKYPLAAGSPTTLEEAVKFLHFLQVNWMRFQIRDEESFKYFEEHDNKLDNVDNRIVYSVPPNKNVAGGFNFVVKDSVEPEQLLERVLNFINGRKIVWSNEKEQKEIAEGITTKLSSLRQASSAMQQVEPVNVRMVEAEEGIIIRGEVVVPAEVKNGQSIMRIRVAGENSVIVLFSLQFYKGTAFVSEILGKRTFLSGTPKIESHAIKFDTIKDILTVETRDPYWNGYEYKADVISSSSAVELKEGNKYSFYGKYGLLRGWEIKINKLFEDGSIEVTLVEPESKAGKASIKNVVFRNKNDLQGFVRELSACELGTYQVEPLPVTVFTDFFRNAEDFARRSSVSSAIDETQKTPGGIDFRVLPMTIQPMGSFTGLNFKLPQLTQRELAKMNIDLEIQQIQNMASSGILPSGRRIKELIAACVQKKEITARADNLLLCLIDICKLEEENAYDTEPEMKEALVIVDSVS
ncbi:MAG: response regulator [Candidatus Omnitrophota bacterium]|nr:response regulator [Candidatus Omnitrophota bacterium]